MKTNYNTCFDCESHFKEDYKLVFVDIKGYKVSKCFTCLEKTLHALPKNEQIKLELMDWLQSAKVYRKVIVRGITNEKRIHMRELMNEKAAYYEQIALMLTNTLNEFVIRRCDLYYILKDNESFEKHLEKKGTHLIASVEGVDSYIKIYLCKGNFEPFYQVRDVDNEEYTFALDKFESAWNFFVSEVKNLTVNSEVV